MDGEWKKGRRNEKEKMSEEERQEKAMTTRSRKEARNATRKWCPPLSPREGAWLSLGA
jgi:hypothetical protein